MCSPILTGMLLEVWVILSPSEVPELLIFPEGSLGEQSRLISHLRIWEHHH